MIDEKNITSGAEQTLESFGYKQELNRSLGLGAVLLFGMAYMAPCTIFSYYGLIGTSTHGMVAMSYLIATIAMFFTALSYRQMVKAFPIAGSVYNYTAKSMKQEVGFMSGWTIMLDYILLPMINYIIACNFIPILFPSIPRWLCIVILIAVVTLINLVGVKFLSAVDNILVIFQFVFVLVAIVFALKLIFAEGYSLIDINGLMDVSQFGVIGMDGLIGGAAILCLCFLGFDSVTTLAEEARDPGKTVGSALILLVVIVGGYFVLSTYIFQISYPKGWMEMDPDNGAYDLLGHIAPQWMATAIVIVMIAACVACAVSSQAACARILYGMGRDKQLPKLFAHVSKKNQVPDYGIIAIGITSLVAIILDLDLASTMINFGALLGFSMVSVSVIAWYWVKNKKRGGHAILNYLIFPIIGICICMYLWANLGMTAMIIGFIWIIIGIICMVIAKKRGVSLDQESL
ncbi:MAG: APC family permease [Eubacteriales bacterium]|nr:APC family permease [Eubacteriales bacterium]